MAASRAAIHSGACLDFGFAEGLSMSVLTCVTVRNCGSDFSGLGRETSFSTFEGMIPRSVRWL